GARGVGCSGVEAAGGDALTGSGVYYGSAPAEAAAVAGEDVAVVGAANSAGQAAVDLATRARSVTVLCRSEGLEKSMSHYLVERIGDLANVEVRTRAVVTGASGDGRLEELTVAVDGRAVRLPVTAAFVFIGARPQTDWLGDTVARDAGGFILSGPAVQRVEGRHRWRLERDPFPLETSLPGVFVAGDVRDQSIKRVASAVGEGSMAVRLVPQCLGGLLPPGLRCRPNAFARSRSSPASTTRSWRGWRPPAAIAASPPASTSSTRGSTPAPSTSSWTAIWRPPATWRASRC